MLRRFLADVKKGASLTPGQRIKSNVIPLVAGLSFIGTIVHLCQEVHPSNTQPQVGSS